MRLLRLYIDKYLLLRDLDLDFDRPGRLDTASYSLDFLVGVNGSGKSTVMRALAQIFSDLRAGRSTDFDYLVEYVLQGRDGPYHVRVGPGKTGAAHMTVRRGGAEGEKLFDDDSVDERYLPARLVIHSTGSDAEWDGILARTTFGGADQAASPETLVDPVQRVVKEVPGHLPATEQEDASEGEPPFLLVRASRLPLVTLCGLLGNLASDEKPLDPVLYSVGIRHVRGFSLRFRLHTALSDRTTFDILKNRGPRHVRQGNDHLLVFDLSQDGRGVAKGLLEHPDIGGSLALFGKLNKLLDPDQTGQPTLQQVNIFFEREIVVPEEGEEAADVSRLLLLDWLSDGEQSFLGRMALLAMLDADDSLILLDEPEVHFNDYWKREVVSLLNGVLGERSNHVLITTHSGILLSDVTEAQITLLVRTKAGVSEVRPVGLKTLGADVGEILVSVFGADMPTGAAAVKRFVEAVSSGDRETVESQLALVNPGMWRFRLIQRLRELDAPSA